MAISGWVCEFSTSEAQVLVSIKIENVAAQIFTRIRRSGRAYANALTRQACGIILQENN